MNKNFLVKLFLLSLLVLSISFGEAQDSHEEFNSIRSTSEQILKICPPEKCVVVGLGRSPTPIIAYLDEESNDNIWSVPLSEFRYGVFADYLGDDLKKNLFEHFDKFLPTISQLNGRSVLLLDYSQSGASLMASQYYMVEYYRSKNKENIENGSVQGTTVDTAALISTDINSSIDPRIKHLIYLPTGYFSTKLKSQGYDIYSAYGSFHIYDDAIDKVPRDSYKSFRENIKNMKKQNVESQEYVPKIRSFDYPLYDKSFSLLKKQKIFRNLYSYSAKDIEKNITLILEDDCREVIKLFAKSILEYNNFEDFLPYYLKLFEKGQDTSALAIQAILNSPENKMTRKFREKVLEKIITSENEKTRELALNTILRLFAGRTYSPNYMSNEMAVNLVQIALTDTDEKFSEKVMDELDRCYEFELGRSCYGPVIFERFSEDEQNSIFQAALNSKSPLVQSRVKAFLDPNLQYDQNMPHFMKFKVLKNLNRYPKEVFEKNFDLILKDPSQKIRVNLPYSILSYKDVDEYLPNYLKLFEEDQATSELAIKVILNYASDNTKTKFRVAVLEKILAHKDEKNRYLALNATLRLFAGAYMSNEQAVKLIQTALMSTDDKFSEKVLDELLNSAYNINYKEPFSAPAEGPATMTTFSEAEKDLIYQTGLSAKSPIVQAKAKLYFLEKIGSSFSSQIAECNCL